MKIERQILQHYRGSRIGSTPQADNIAYGEIAITYAKGDESIFIKNSEDEIIKAPLVQDFSNLVTQEEFEGVETAALGAIPSGTLGTINGMSIESGNSITLDLSLYKIVPKLPTEDILDNKIYIVPTAKTENETEFGEFIWVGDKWDQLGTLVGKVDLSEYLKTTDADKKYMPKGSISSGSSADSPALSISTTGAFNNYGNNGQAFNAVRSVTGHTGATGSGYPLNAASFGVKLDGNTAFSHKKYDTFDKNTGAYTGAKNTAVLMFSGRAGLLYAKNTGTAADVTDAMYKRVGVIDSPDEAQRCYSAKQVDDLLKAMQDKIDALEKEINTLKGV